jgi:hypothetical protein
LTSRVYTSGLTLAKPQLGNRTFLLRLVALLGPLVKTKEQEIAAMRTAEMVVN